MAKDEISSELIKLTILRLVKNRSHGEYKWNLLSGLAHGQSAVEISLGVTLDPQTKYRASLCFDELKRDGYLLWFDNSNTNPDDWVKITEKGLKALEAGVIDPQPPAESTSLSHFGVPDLKAFKSTLSALVSQLNDEELVSCVFMDLDNFKSVNDQHDHSVGDQVIQEAIRVVAAAVKGKGKLFHRSGDEMVVLLQNFSPQEACAVAERIRHAIEENDFPVIGKGFVTATLGVSTCPTVCTLEELEVSADKAAMAAKKNGKNQVVFAGSDAGDTRKPMIPFRKQLDEMLAELKANAVVAAKQGNDRIDYSSRKLDDSALATLPEETRYAVDSGYGAIKKIELLVRRFENATTNLAIIESGNTLIEYKVRELHQITNAIKALENHLAQTDATGAAKPG